MKHIAFDILGPLTVTNQGEQIHPGHSRLLLQMNCSISMPDQETSTVADCLVKEVIHHFGVPLLIHSALGSNFDPILQSALITRHEEDSVSV